jgi:hypothetical protein
MRGLIILMLSILRRGSVGGIGVFRVLRGRGFKVEVGMMRGKVRGGRGGVLVFNSLM